MPESFASAARAAALVTQMAAATVLGALLGRELDARFATAPALLLAGLLGGFAAGMVAIFRQLAGPEDDPDRDGPRDPDDPRPPNADR